MMPKSYALAVALSLAICATPALAAPGDGDNEPAIQQNAGSASTGASSGTSGSGEPLSPGEAANNPGNVAADSAGETPRTGGGDPNRAWPVNRPKD